MGSLELSNSLPPVLPDLMDTLETYLTSFESLPIHDSANLRRYWPRTPQPASLCAPKLSPIMTSIEVERDLATGDINGIKEVFHSGRGTTAKDSFSLRRIPGPPEEAVRGSSTNYPFWPGGIPEPSVAKDDAEEDRLFDPKNFLKRHPKLSRGIEFNTIQEARDDLKEDKEEIVSIADMLKIDESVLSIFDTKEEVKQKHNKFMLNDFIEEENELVNEFKVESGPISVAPSLPNDDDVIKISEGSGKVDIKQKDTEWAIAINVHEPVDNFSSLIPNPACSYNFELDIFQKQAILHVEKHNSVFVAAHTSAGKTVIAEYCIALSLKHMTRSIYTSPIKALSNQKFRDLKQKFEDVGLLTGDIQINVKASCLIMTTEILQSMLYNGSDIIRDLEWVIFDEVHYINNAERGHVWEEVIIMLPSHVNIVLLSATVPNTIEFADWIGRIKKRKIYVISTTKRPVPLEHYLYTGTGGKSKDERFLLVDSEGNFMKNGYSGAVNAKKEREKKLQQTHGPKPGQRHHMGQKQEMNMWIGLIDHLSRNDLLPVVAFTLSKKRCDQNASLLESQDLTTAREKGEIHAFIKKCTDRLQGPDKNLPQVLHMKNLLKKGIGVHHSGILPILKEVVEMLFAKSLVKLLFATETFAMGVNMPARSVVFDSTRKHDGQQFRDLVPSEYIQMAGRAGRRGIDTTGTVIILCKTEVPEMASLYKMMLGKPSKLESQFKLTYSMILNLLRVEALRVEDMLKRSFSESLTLLNQSKYEDELKSLEEDMNKQPDLECMVCNNLDTFYGATRDFFQFRTEVTRVITTHPNIRKVLQVGRIIIFSQEMYLNYIGCIVQVDQRDTRKYTVFVLKDSSSEAESSPNANYIKCCLLTAYDKLSCLEKTSKHDIVEVLSENIVCITKTFIKIDGDKVVSNVKQRQIPRFRDNPPGQTVMELIKELQRLNETGNEGMIFLSFVNDFGLKDLDCVEKLIAVELLLKRIMHLPCLECPQFSEHFSQAFKKLQLREKIARLKYLLSEESLKLHPEYQSRIDVLKNLGYIEENNTVTLKGRVACEMSNHELMVTELILENVFAEKSIEECAALLSSLVFQQRNCSEPSLTDDLTKGVKQFKDVAEKIGITQRDCGLKEAVGDFVDQYNFGLTEVVYQWALGMPFNSIQELTDVQEGITVKCIQRLDEALRDVRNAARIIGEPNLYEKMENASNAIKRDIVFAASLYIQ